MDPGGVLLVSSDRQILDQLPGILGKRSELPVLPVTRVIDALQEVAKADYRAAVCVVESPDELACVIRLKKAKPELPVLMLTRSADPALKVLGEQMGADAVIQSDAPPPGAGGGPPDAGDGDEIRRGSPSRAAPG